MESIRTGEEISGHVDYADRGVVGQAGQRSLMLWRVLSALLLLTMGGIHLYLVLTGFGGLLGVLFVLNAIGGVVLAIAMIAAIELEARRHSHSHREVGSKLVAIGESANAVRTEVFARHEQYPESIPPLYCNSRQTPNGASTSVNRTS